MNFKALIALAGTLLACYSSDANAGSQSFNYDALGRLVLAGASDGNFTQYAYDPAGNRTAKNTFVPSQTMRSWEGEDLPHLIGAADNDGWAVTIADSQNFISYGPYVSDISVGDHVGVWKMMVDNNTADNFDIVRLDVNDATTGEILATRNIKRKEWTAANAYEYFYVPWRLDPPRQGHSIELRTFYLGFSYLRLDRVGLDTNVYHNTSLASMAQSWEAEALSHQAGFADGDGWAANVATTRTTLVFGPYTTSIPQGAHVAVWKIQVDNTTFDQRPIVTLDVWDSTSSKRLATTVLFRNAWSAPNTYEYFGLPFSIGPGEVGHAIEIRVFYNGYAYVRVDKVGYQ